MSETEVKFEIDEHGRIGYRVTNEGVLLSKDEKEFIIDHIARMQEENAKLRELCVKALEWLRWAGGITCPPEVPDEFADELRELGVEVVE